MSRNNVKIAALRQVYADEGVDASPRRMKWARACQGGWRYSRAHEAWFRRSRGFCTSPLETVA